MNKYFYQKCLTPSWHNKLLYALISLCLLEFIWLSITPNSREDWLLENVLVLVSGLLILWYCQKFSLSKMSWGMMIVFLMIHELGAHYTYSEVPYDNFLNATLGFKLNTIMGWERNHFDRLAHFSFGLLLVLPLQEMCSQVSQSTSHWTYFVALNFIMSISLLFELFEWGAAWLFGGELGVAYLGTQGDVWDAQQDMLIAIIGGLLMLLIRLLIIKLSRAHKTSSCS